MLFNYIKSTNNKKNLISYNVCKVYCSLDHGVRHGLKVGGGQRKLDWASDWIVTKLLYNKVKCHKMPI